MELPCSSLDRKPEFVGVVRGDSSDARFCIAIACTNHWHNRTLVRCMGHVSTPLCWRTMRVIACGRAAPIVAIIPPRGSHRSLPLVIPYGVCMECFPCQLTGTIRRSKAVRLKVRLYQQAVASLRVYPPVATAIILQTTGQTLVTQTTCIGTAYVD